MTPFELNNLEFGDRLIYKPMMWQCEFLDYSEPIDIVKVRVSSNNKIFGMPAQCFCDNYEKNNG